MGAFPLLSHDLLINIRPDGFGWEQHGDIIICLRILSQMDEMVRPGL